MSSERKQDHIENYFKSQFKANTLFENIYIEHFALTDLNFNDIDTNTIFLGKKTFLSSTYKRNDWRSRSFI